MIMRDLAMIASDFKQTPEHAEDKKVYAGLYLPHVANPRKCKTR